MRMPVKFLKTLFLIVLVILILPACGGTNSEPTPTEFVEKEGGDAFIGIPNPASFYCQEMGYTLEIRENEDGAQGICIMPDVWGFLMMGAG